jgi:hypothetical protein
MHHHLDVEIELRQSGDSWESRTADAIIAVNAILCDWERRVGGDHEHWH